MDNRYGSEGKPYQNAGVEATQLHKIASTTGQEPAKGRLGDCLTISAAAQLLKGSKMNWKGWKALTAIIVVLCLAQPLLAAIYSIPFFSQRDGRWYMPTGCATTSMAMGLAYRGSGADPGKLDAWLKKNGGYDSNGLLRWDVACKYNGTQWLKYENRSTLPDLKTLSSQLANGKIVIAESKRFPSHFVTIRGVTPDGTVGYYWDPWDTAATQRRIGDGWVNVGAGTRVFAKP